MSNYSLVLDAAEYEGLIRQIPWIDMTVAVGGVVILGLAASLINYVRRHIAYMRIRSHMGLCVGTQIYHTTGFDTHIGKIIDINHNEVVVDCGHHIWHIIPTEFIKDWSKVK